MTIFFKLILFKFVFVILFIDLSILLEVDQEWNDVTLNRIKRSGRTGGRLMAAGSPVTTFLLLNLAAQALALKIIMLRRMLTRTTMEPRIPMGPMMPVTTMAPMMPETTKAPMPETEGRAPMTTKPPEAPRSTPAGRYRNRERLGQARFRRPSPTRKNAIKKKELRSGRLFRFGSLIRINSKKRQKVSS